MSRLKVLVAVASAGSITQAADRLGYTPPALSQSLTKLEREAGTPLLVRHRRGVELTPAGEVLVEHARRVLDELERARYAVAEVARLNSGTVRIGTFATAGTRLLPPVLAAFRRAHPAVRLHLREYEPPAGLRALAAGEVDLVLTHTYDHGPAEPAVSGVAVETLRSEELVLVTAAGHALDQPGVPLAWRELSGRAMIAEPSGRGSRDALEALMRGEGLGAPDIAFESQNYTVTCALVAAGLGVAVLPLSALEVGGPPLGRRPLAAPGLNRTVRLAWRTEDTNPALQPLRALLRQLPAPPG
ncbi:DNA-binding transcriptional LysR family regulator [Allonocardiopsis opalescens]|uniref:DNA-binding transcriptional LysR family regulator n=1 Tax=Allonocardiopsis opalescens TaxID=1144618 RepID=A0A2T0Q4W4_9ACTN|nr:DNA-binding transcriptional LysR family regulator [Allonocardiopsis opalescens]